MLELKNINHYFGGLYAVKHFNFTIKQGELVGLIGPNGAGKTTIFNLVSGFYKPTQGEILFQNKEITKLKPHAITSLGIARTFQNIRLWNTMTVLENLCMSQHYKLGYGIIDSIIGSKKYKQGEKKVRQNAEKILEFLSLSSFANHYPKNLPYGIQRRVEIGRALTIEPDLILLDEPAAGMNPNEIKHLIELIDLIRKNFNITIWLIEHQMKVVMTLCERIKVIDFGETIAEGIPSEIRNNSRVIKAYLGEE